MVQLRDATEQLHVTAVYSTILRCHCKIIVVHFHTASASVGTFCAPVILRWLLLPCMCAVCRCLVSYLESGIPSFRNLEYGITLTYHLLPYHSITRVINIHCRTAFH